MALFISDDAKSDGRSANTASEPARAGSADPVVADRGRPLNRTIFGIGVAITAGLFAVGAWERRWIADDGLIVLRTVRNLMVGNGPVFNRNERVETNTSAAWTFVVYVAGKVTMARLEYVVLTLALVMSVAAIVLAMLGTARLRGGVGTSLMLPAGALVYIALPPARDFATSGLETCLTIFWLATLWVLLVRWAVAEQPRLSDVLALVFTAGLGWLVRPEMAIVSALVLVVVLLSPPPGTRFNPWVRRLGQAAVAGFVPLGYEIWRMGYYGLPYPNTAIAKEATGSNWGKGFGYLWNTVGPYWLWFPLVLFVIVAVVLGWRPTLSRFRIRVPLRSPEVVVGLMLLSGLLLLVFMLKVGGDFMHGRMLLPPLFCLLLPVMVVPVRAKEGWRRWGVPLVAWSLVLLWGVMVANSSVAANKIGNSGIVDERAFYVRNSGHEHPILAEDYLDYSGGWMRAMINGIQTTPGGLLIPSSQFTFWDIVPRPLPIPTNVPGHTVYFLNLGMTSMNVPLNVRVIDQEGLAYPLAAHTERLTDGRIGHDKLLAPDWVIADLGLVDRHPGLLPYINEDWVREAHVALTCPQTRQLLDSYRAPMTVKRWLQNVTHAFAFAKYRVDRVPEYEIARCGLTEPELIVPRDN